MKQFLDIFQAIAAGVKQDCHLLALLWTRLCVLTCRFLIWLLFKRFFVWPLQLVSCDFNEHWHPQLSHLTDVTRPHTERSCETDIYHKPSVLQHDVTLHACITQLYKDLTSWETRRRDVYFYTCWQTRYSFTQASLADQVQKKQMVNKKMNSVQLTQFAKV